MMTIDHGTTQLHGVNEQADLAWRVRDVEQAA
jgi:hypothetical protein